MPHLSDLLGFLGSRPSAQTSADQQGLDDQRVGPQSDQQSLFAGLFSQITDVRSHGESSGSTSDTDAPASLVQEGDLAFFSFTNPAAPNQRYLSDLAYGTERAGQHLTASGLGDGIPARDGLEGETGLVVQALGLNGPPAGTSVQSYSAYADDTGSGSLVTQADLVVNAQRRSSLDSLGMNSAISNGTMPTIQADPDEGNSLRIVSDHVEDRILTDIKAHDRALVEMSEQGLLTKRLIAKQTGLSAVSAMQPISQFADPFGSTPSLVVSGDTVQTINTQVQISGTSPVLVSGQIAQNALAQVAQALATVNTAGDSMEIQLDPPELGRVFIDFNFDGDRIVNATVSAEQSDTASLMKKNSEILLRELSNAGFGDVELSFQDHADSRFADNRENNESPSQYSNQSSNPSLVTQTPTQILTRPENAGLDLRL